MHDGNDGDTKSKIHEVWTHFDIYLYKKEIISEKNGKGSYCTYVHIKIQSVWV